MRVKISKEQRDAIMALRNVPEEKKQAMREVIEDKRLIKKFQNKKRNALLEKKRREADKAGKYFSKVQLTNTELSKCKKLDKKKALKKDSVSDVLASKGTRPKGKYYNQPSTPLDKILGPLEVDTKTEEALAEARINYFGAKS